MRCTGVLHTRSLVAVLMLTLPPAARRSVEILSPLLTDQMRAHPAWASWVKLVELFTMCIKHELDVSDIERIDDLQIEYVTLFLAVPEYAGFYRPKHHFLTHLARDIWRYGPPRGFWTFGFESFNKVIKAGAKRSNFRCETLSIMEYWSMWSARTLLREQREQHVRQYV